MSNKPIDTEEAGRRWDRFADAYSAVHGEQGDIHKEVFLNPSLFSLMGPLDGKKVLDAGCGEGYLSRLMAQSGAIVTAVDYSKRMVEIAHERTPDHLKIEYKKGNCEDLHFLQDEQFDLVVSNMVIHDLANYKDAFNEIYRLLKGSGVFVFSILHPCFVTPGSGWEKDSDGKKLHWNTDNYFYEGVYEQKLGEEENVLFYHRTLTSYISALLDTGFSLDNVIEPFPSDNVIEKSPSFEEDLRCPDFIVFKLRKNNL